MGTKDPTTLSIAELADALAAGHLSSVEVTDAALARIERLNPRFHAFVTVTAARARDDALRADRERAAGRGRGRLNGVPIALKDVIDTAGIATAAGMPTVRGAHVPERDATVARRLREAGAVLLGKLTTTEGAFAEHHPTVPVPVNPWSAGRWAGVSSSGSGVAVAARMTPAALGTDTLGSIRFPSACCGLTALKPSYGRVSRAGVFPLAASLDHVGPMCRSAEDCALVLATIAGVDPCDPTSISAPVPNYADAITAPIDGLRIGFDPNAFRDIDSCILDALEATCATMESLGARIVTFPPPLPDPMLGTWSVLICAAETALAHEPYFPEWIDRYGDGLRMMIETGRALPAMELARLSNLRAGYANQLATALQMVDAFLLPVFPTPTPDLDEVGAGLADPESTARLLRFTALANFAGVPSLTLPVGADLDGLPIAAQLVGRALSEDLVLRIGHAFQRATDWHLREPPVI